MTCLALDPGQRTGWATSGRDCGTLDFSGLMWGEISAQFRPWLSRMLRESGVQAIACERVFVGRNDDTTLALGLVWDACAIAMQHNVEFMECQSQQAKRALGVVAKRGQRAAGKHAVMAAAIARGWTPRAQHEADAIAVLAWAEDRLSRVE